MKNKKRWLFVIAVLTITTGCTRQEIVPDDTEISNKKKIVTEEVSVVGMPSEEMKTEEIVTEDVATEEKAVSNTESTDKAIVLATEESIVVESSTDIEDVYEGTYNDENGDEGLIIVAQEDGTYRVDISIFRLTYLEGGEGMITDEGLEFVAIDASENPIKGIITLEGDEAVVTFTNSTWTHIANGDTYRYVKAK